MLSSKLFYIIEPPEDATVSPGGAVITNATGAAAANFTWVANLGANAPNGACFVTLEASTTDCWVRFKPTATAAATTTTNGLIVKAGQPGRPFWVNPSRHGVIDVISTGVGSIQLHVSSPIGNRNTI